MIRRLLDDGRTWIAGGLTLLLFALGFTWMDHAEAQERTRLQQVAGAYGATWKSGALSEKITLSTGGATTNSTANLLPANSIIKGVTCRVLTTITTATDWSVGDPTTAARFSAANSTLTAGTTSVGLQHYKGAISTDATGPVQVAAAKLRITTTGTPGAGAVRCTVFYESFTAPGS